MRLFPVCALVLSSALFAACGATSVPSMPSTPVTTTPPPTTVATRNLNLILLSEASGSGRVTLAGPSQVSKMAAVPGSVTFESVPVGVYTLTVEGAAFLPAIQTVTVDEARTVASAEVTLTPAEVEFEVPGVPLVISSLACVPVDNKIHKPQALHLVLPADADDAVKATFAQAVAYLRGVVKTPIDLDPNSMDGARISVSVEPGFTVDGRRSFAYTEIRWDAKGVINWGRMRFDTPGGIRDLVTVIHEIFRALGIVSSSPQLGLLSATPWSRPELSEAERKMVEARDRAPLLQSCRK